MKKFVSILLAVCIMMGICVTASAAAADTYDLSTATKSCVLTISSGRADFTSRFYDSDTSIKSVRIDQTLEKHSFLWFWDSLGKWNLTTYDNTAVCSNAKRGLTSGTYRVKSDFTVTYYNGHKETVTVYSNEKKIA